jgi:hypothetical protein
MRHGAKRAITGILDEVFGRLPPSLARDKIMPYRLELERHLHGMVRQARSKGALDLYLPVEYVHGVAVPASFIVSRGMLGGGEFLDASQVVATMAAESADASAVTVDGVTGVRFERIAEPDRTQEMSAASRRVDYVLPVPGLPGDWLPCHMAVIHLPSPGMVPLLVGFGVWRAEGDRVTQLRRLAHADEPDAMEPPIVEECFTEKLGSGLKSLCYLRQPGESIVSGSLNYAWRSERLETAVRMFTSCPDLSRLQRAMPDIEALTQVISFVQR